MEAAGAGQAPAQGTRTFMWRWLAVATLLYAFGHSGFDAYRPAAFDRSLREFHRDVNRLTEDGIRTATAFDQAGTLRYLNSLSVHFQAMLSNH